MSDRLINIRILDWHFGINRRWRPFLSRNRYHRENNWPDGKMAIYEFFNWL